MTFNAKALGMTGVYLLVFVLAAFLVDSGSSPIGSLLIAAVVVVGVGWGFVASAKLNGWLNRIYASIGGTRPPLAADLATG
jgi:hypothetical protein